MTRKKDQRPCFDIPKFPRWLTHLRKALIGEEEFHRFECTSSRNFSMGNGYVLMQVDENISFYQKVRLRANLSL